LAESQPLVADASVVSRWFVSNPPFLEETARVRSDFEAGRISLVAPENLLHEVAGAIHQAIFAHRLSAQRGTEQLERFLGLDVTLVESADLVLPAFALSIRYGCSYDDATYLEIARRQNYRMLHADGSLRRALAGRFPLELWIEDYR
jgi:predicted nucleic acid-binding protein